MAVKFIFFVQYQLMDEIYRELRPQAYNRYKAELECATYIQDVVVPDNFEKIKIEDILKKFSNKLYNDDIYRLVYVFTK